MNKKDIIRGRVFLLKSNNNCLVEILEVEKSQVRVIVYNITGNEIDIVDISDLQGIPLSIPILNSLGFEKKEGQLMGLPYEHFWQKQLNDYILWILDDEGILKFATIDTDAYYGVKFSPLPYLHELQNIIGPIDVAKLFKDLQTVI